MAAVELDHLGKLYGGETRAITDVSLSIADGEFLVLVGPSGCGKSTLLRMVAGLEEISEGELRIGGVRANERAPKDRDIAMVFQSYALYPHMTSRDNMAFGLKVRKTPKAEIDKRVADAAKLLDIEPLLERLPKDMSGGQRQRVAMGRAIVRQPEVFLFDEPLSNLDASLRSQMRAELKKLHRDLGVTMIYVTHDQVEAMTLADRICVLELGVLQQAGSPAELFDTPANRFVAGFIGSPQMNFLTPTHAGTLGIEAPGGVADFTLGVRPHDLRLGAAGGLAGTVDFIEPMGWEAHVHVRLEDGTAMLVRTETAELAGITGGSSVSVDVDRAKLHFFAPGPDGARL
ncbi:MAG: sn-glycerol-3-phosphate ABC transporter ATP-binding protein UgpC [Proteobacteria bacterium]|nr:sn-glycerol-3-phosphate ABC transporter ATP-binding protein UgpC [Pseudomonadota bacterium]